MTRLRRFAASAGQAPERSIAASAGQAGEGRFGPARHFVTDRRRFNLSTDELVVRVASAVRAGVDVVQVRERDLPDGQLAALVREIVGVAAGTTTRVVVNDRADLAIVAGAAGVHLRGDSPPASRVAAFAASAKASTSARATADKPAPKAGGAASAGQAAAGFLIGRSVHSIADVDAAVADGGCDYLLFGTVFPSDGKPDGHRVAGLDALRDICARSPVPVIAIGGMTEERAAAVRDAGAAGFAAVGLFMCLTPLREVV